MIQERAIDKGRLAFAKTLFSSGFTTSVGGQTVVTNASQSSRFPLPLTIGSAVLIAVGVLATLKGHRLIGYGMAGIGAVGIGAAAAAPEINARLFK